ncbi:MAG TPA: hypothetical protein VGU26_08540 [Gaiellaceae bacterium]|nr:hypothetical protein [Gaiellaceae bacterium]
MLERIGFVIPSRNVCAVYPRGERVDLLFEHGASLTPRDCCTGSGTQTRV